MVFRCEWSMLRVQDFTMHTATAIHFCLTSFHSFCITLLLDIKGLRLQWAHLEDIRALVSEGGYLSSFLLFSPFIPRFGELAGRR